MHSIFIHHFAFNNKSMFRGKLNVAHTHQKHTDTMGQKINRNIDRQTETPTVGQEDGS